VGLPRGTMRTRAAGTCATRERRKRRSTTVAFCRLSGIKVDADGNTLIMVPVMHVTTYIHMYRVGQNHIYTVYIRYFWQGNHQIYGYIRCIYTVLANPTYTVYTYTALASPSNIASTARGIGLSCASVCNVLISCSHWHGSACTKPALSTPTWLSMQATWAEC